MKRLLKYAALIATVMMISSSAWANTYTDHINTAPNNKGDMMVFPWFLALDGGWSTKLTVINTDQTNSVVAKVVIRSFKNSKEMLDFLIFLSPADVWNGRIYYNTVSKAVKVFSDDDSILVDLKPTFASADSPVDQALFTEGLCDGDGSFLGYVEVIEAAWGPVPKAAPGVSKDDIYKDYVATSPVYLNIGGGDNVLAGYMEFGNPVNGLTTTYRATNFRDYENQSKLTTSKETRIGENANNNIAEVEASFSKDFIGLPYVNTADDVALHFFTFPTKLTYGACDALTTNSPFFNSNMDSDMCIVYSLRTYDLKENYPSGGSPYSGGSSKTLKFCDEVNFLGSADFPYKEGWGYYAFGDSTNSADKSLEPIRYVGAPVIPTYLYLGNSGLSGEYGTWTDTLVYSTWTPGSAADVLVDYQYTDK